MDDWDYKYASNERLPNCKNCGHAEVKHNEFAFEGNDHCTICACNYYQMR